MAVIPSHKGPTGKLSYHVTSHDLEFLRSDIRCQNGLVRARYRRMLARGLSDHRVTPQSNHASHGSFYDKNLDAKSKYHVDAT